MAWNRVWEIVNYNGQIVKDRPVEEAEKEQLELQQLATGCDVKVYKWSASKGWLRLALENARERAGKNEECLLYLMMHVSAVALPRAFSVEY